MCGIAGIFQFCDNTDHVSLSKNVKHLLNSIKHRGPDNQGISDQGQCVLGMVRLSIIDIPTGHQPMFSPDNRYSIVFNGEVYNYREIRDGLQKESVTFETNSDTEVILKGYVKYGVKILDLLDGMFAFAIYDSLNEELFIARDRLGKKPLYYYKDSEKLIFCSEVHAISKYIGLDLSLNKQSYWDYLTYRYIPGVDTSYSQIKKFERGEYSLISTSGVTKNSYWSIPRESSSEPIREIKVDSIADRFGTLFSQSVTKRLVSDVPVGVMLSGGIDSCAVLYEVSKHQPIDSYHVFFDTTDNDYNELKYAKQMAQFSGSPLHVVEATRQDFYDQLLDISKITDEPLSDLASIPFKMVCDLAAKNVKVALSGEGSDEILAGYGINSIQRRLQLLSVLNRVPESIRRWVRVIVEKREGRKIALFDEVGKSIEQWGKNSNYNITYQISHNEKAEFLHADTEHEFFDSSRFLHELYDSVEDEDVINQLLHIVSSDWLEQDVLMKSDKVSMSSSLELRCPFLDHHLVEYLFKVPGNFKVGNLNGQHQSKLLLKKYLYGKIPDNLVFRKKLGFPVPSYDLKAQKDVEFMYDILNSDDCYYLQIFQKNKVMKLLDSLKYNFSESGSLKHFLWSMVVYELWAKGKV
jgi:asparagine synthase (glutamine-hydrolysing)